MTDLKNESESWNKESQESQNIQITISDYLNPYPVFDPRAYRQKPKKVELPKEFIERYNQRILELTEMSLFEKIERHIYWTNKLSSLFFKIIGALVMGNLKTTITGWISAILIWFGGYITTGKPITIETFLTGAAAAALGTLSADSKENKKEKEEGW